MKEYIFTKKGHEALKKIIEKTQQMLNQARELKGEAASGQDGWHDEGFKIAATDEMMWERRLAELKHLYHQAKIVEAKEQNKIVDLGTGVILRFEDGSMASYIIEGFTVEALENRLSIHSPLGEAIIGAKTGEKRSFKVGNNKKTVTIEKIVLPSKAEEIFMKEFKK